LVWWNGNRSILADDGLSGIIAGLTLQTGRAEIYRALLEASKRRARWDPVWLGSTFPTRATQRPTAASMRSSKRSTTHWGAITLNGQARPPEP
jgi:hypothetical protein